jgi:DNA processing protein
MSDTAGRPTDSLRLTDEQRIAWLRLIRSDSVGPVTFRELVNHFGSAAAAIDAIPELSARGGRTARVASRAEAEREIERTAAAGAQIVAIGEADYPHWLRHVDGAPPLLTIKGSTTLFPEPVVAIVGSRNASLAGAKIARMIAAGLGGAGYVIASGLARGIDAAAHDASLASGTIAVLAGGIDILYPPENAPLADRIVAGGGALVSEMPCGHEPRARDFPRRNRIISGLSLGVIVVEAADRSGSLITARRAAEQGRLVFAVPGSPLDPRAAGTNKLIQDGAKLVMNADDVIAELRPMLDRRDDLFPEAGESEADGEPIADADDSERARILAGLGPTPVEVDDIVRFTGLRPAVVHLVLLELDLAGRLARHPGQRVSLVPD